MCGFGPLDDRREHLRDMISTLPDTIRYSETFDAPLSELMREVKKHQLEGIVAKRAGSHYQSGERSADWLKWRANRGQEFGGGGYLPSGDALDSTLVGYYEGTTMAATSCTLPLSAPASRQSSGASCSRI